jgi:pimeloyl-ACP methyl ester carboxylesterase
VLVHGLTGTGRTWWRVGPALAQGGRFVVAVDLRGHGSSGGASAATTLDDLAADVLETVAAIVGEGDVDVVGHSLGALTVLRAAGMSDRFRRVVAEDPADRDVRLELVADDVLASAARARAEPERFVADVRAEHPGWPEQDLENELLGHQEIEAEPFAAAIRRFRFDLLDLLERAQAPLLLVVGAEARDSRLTGETRREALSRFRASEHDAGHVVHRDDYDGYVRVLSDFLDEPDRSLHWPPQGAFV